MDLTTEPNPAKPTDELLRLIQQEFLKLFKAVTTSKEIDLPFIHIGPNGKPNEALVSFLYQGGLAHVLLDHDHGAAFLEDHLELFYLCSEAHTRLANEAFCAPFLIDARDRLLDPPEGREARLIRSILRVQACTSNPGNVTVTFHPG